MHCYIKQREFELPSYLQWCPSFGLWACGPASLETCFKLLGNERISGNEVLMAVRTDWKDQFSKFCGVKEGAGGTDKHELMTGARRLGFGSYARHYRSGATAWTLLRRNAHQQLPTILAVDNDSHWLVSYGAARSHAWIMDPNDAATTFERVSRAELLARWEFEGAYEAVTIRPESTKAVQAHATGGIPPSDLVLASITCPESAEGVVTLRSDLSSVLGELESRSGKKAIDVYAEEVRPHLERALRRWTEVDRAWIEDRLDLIHDLLWHLSVKLSASSVAPFTVGVAALVTADAMISEGIDPGSGDADEVLLFERDTRVLFGSRGGRTAASRWLEKNGDMLAATVGHWLGGRAKSRARNHVMQLSRVSEDLDLTIADGDESPALVNAAVLLLLYEWLGYP